MRLISRLSRFVAVFAIAFSALPGHATAQQQSQYDVIVYGGTCAAVTTAVQVKRMGKSVAIVCPDKHLGGLSSGGLGWTDSGDKSVIGGLSREFYQRVWQHYQSPEAWTWQTQSKFGYANQTVPKDKPSDAAMWVFEPHVAESIFEAMIDENEIDVFRDQWIDRTPLEEQGAGQAVRGVTLDGSRIASIRTLDGTVYAAKVFIDATYEGDLMAAAGVNFHVGREANSVYGEQWNGIQVGVLHHKHHFTKPTDPYRIPGDPSSGLLPRISAEDPGKRGEGDHRIQAYCFRMCLTNVDENRIPFSKPDGYDANEYELLLRVFDSGWREQFRKFDAMPNGKTDTNNHGPFSTDNIGMNYDYPNGSYERRQEIIAEHEQYQKGLMYFMANDPRVPAEVREAMAKWGLPKDEFVDNGGWSHQLYIREARRMIGEYVMTENDCFGKRMTPDSIGMGSYTLDSHNAQRYVKADGTVQNEGDIGVHPHRAYEIAYGSIVPKQAECENLLVPVCVSSSHIAFGSIRMEPVFMILGQSAGTAACLAIDEGIAVQEVKYEALKQQLLDDEQVLAKASKKSR
ncbi:FAD-dependent oxidoreductase [Neorhodopirellula lusitana]|uniref:FAD-dependent oxidoreductase n=1 Tax=Neorhodopirellula lusitana TaxID=445327 RepID=UPI00384E9B9F